MSDCRYCCNQDAKCVRDKCETCCGCGRRFREPFCKDEDCGIDDQHSPTCYIAETERRGRELERARIVALARLTASQCNARCDARPLELFANEIEREGVSRYEREVDQ